MFEEYFGIGTTLAGILNLETWLSDPPRIEDGDAIPLVGSVRSVLGNGGVRFDGAINVPYRMDSEERTGFNKFINEALGGFTTAYVTRYITWIDEEGFYSPFLVEFVRPTRWRNANDTYVADIEGELRNCRLQYVTKTGNYTVTTADRLVYVDTSGGSRTMTLPALSGVTEGTVYSFKKLVAANSLILDPNSSETIEGSSTLTLTAINSRVDITKDSSSNWKVILAR